MELDHHLQWIDYNALKEKSLSKCKLGIGINRRLYVE